MALSKNSNKSIADDSKVVQFERYHTITFLVLMLMTLVSFITILIYQYRNYLRYDSRGLKKDFQDLGLHMNQRFGNIKSRLESIEISATQDLFDSRHSKQEMPFAFRFLHQSDDGTKFNMDIIPPEYKGIINVNLTGVGSLDKKSDKDFLRRIRMYLNLSDDLKALKKSIPEIIFLYSMSVDRTFLHYPWVPSKTWSFKDEYYDYEFWQKSLPKNNPDRKAFWTNVYTDPGEGLMVTCAIPVYDNDKFVCIVAADIMLDFLNKLAERFEPHRKGQVIIYDTSKNVMAAPGLVRSKDKKIKKLKDVLPKTLLSHYSSIVDLRNNLIYEDHGLNYMGFRFASSNARMIYIYSQLSFYQWIIGKIGFETLCVIIGMFLLLVIFLYITHRNMVAPSEKFVNFILDKSENKDIGVDQKIPAIWMPWFTAIDNVFNENRILTEDLSEKNIELQNKNISLHQEIEARNKSEEEKRRLERQLHQEEKVKAIGMLAGGVAHDFNNQLGVIIGYTSVMLAHRLPENQVTDCLEQILSSAKSSAELTKQLLAFAQKGDYQRVPVNVHSTIEEVIALLSHTIDKRISINVSLNAPLYTISGDPSQLQNVIMNLAINASHAMPNGGMITFSTSSVFLSEQDCKWSDFDLEPGQHIEIKIFDTGTGMDSETKKHIFEPFFTTKQSGTGTGLGLAAALGTIKNYKGFIGVESAVGVGSTFTIILPTMKRNVEVKVAKMSEKLRQISSPRTILVVDDEDKYCRMFTDFLGSVGYNVKAFSDPFDAIKYYKDTWEEIDLVILDMIMPKISGKDFLKELNRVNSNVKVVISSGYSLEEETRRLLEKSEQILRFFRKPYSMVDFTNGITDIIEKISSHKQ